MTRLARTLGSIALTAVITCSCAVAVAWPSTTEADDFAMPAEGIGVDTTVVGSVEVTAALVQDPGGAGGGGWSLEIKAHNTNSESEATAEIEENVLKSVFRAEMSRAPSIPMVAWKVSDKVQLAAGETKTIRHKLPPWLATQVAATTRPPKLDKNGIPVGGTPPSFSTMVASKEDAAGQRQARVSSRSRLAAPMRPLPRNAYSDL